MICSPTRLIAQFSIILFVVLASIGLPWYTPRAAAMTSTAIGVTLVQEQLVGVTLVQEQLDRRPPGVTDPKELEAFVDRTLGSHVPEDLPGAVFVLVKDDHILFSKGYGYANLEQNIPMDPDQTVFRVGSLAKLITTTALLQLVEQGKVRLDEDITTHLGPLPTNNHGLDPVTPQHLLTHTDGFDVAWTLNSATQCQGELPSLENFLATELPRRIFQPGQIFIYGDVGLTLAGRLVEVVAQRPFEQQVAEAVLKPLDMHSSSFVQPPPPHLLQHLATGYRYHKGQFSPTKSLCFKSAPSNALTSSALDMAHFMIAQLNQGRYGDRQILQPNTVKILHSRQAGNFPPEMDLPGSAYGLYERHIEGQKTIRQKILEHGGSMYGYISQILLLPDQNTGFFLAYNTNNLESSLREEFITQFLEHYYPLNDTVPSPSPVQPRPTFQRPSAEFQSVAQQVAGQYRHVRYPRDSLAKIGMTILSPQPSRRLIANADGSITMRQKQPGSTQVAESRWEEVAPLVFQYPGAESYIALKRDAQGRILAASFSGFVFWVFEKIAWYETDGVQLGFVVTLGVIFLSAIVASLVMVMRYRQQKNTLPYWPRLTVGLAGLIATLHLLSILGIAVALQFVYYWEFILGVPPIVIMLLYGVMIAVGLTPILSGLVVWNWRNDRWPIATKLHTLVITLAAWGIIPLLKYWNFLGLG